MCMGHNRVTLYIYILPFGLRAWMHEDEYIITTRCSPKQWELLRYLHAWRGIKGVELDAYSVCGMGFSSAVPLVFVALIYHVAANGISPMCRTPNLPLNGGVKGGTQPLYSVGSVLYYTCNDGFQLQNGFSWTACRLNKQGTYWQNNPPTCARKRICKEHYKVMLLRWRLRYINKHAQYIIKYLVDSFYIPIDRPRAIWSQHTSFCILHACVSCRAGEGGGGGFTP